VIDGYCMGARLVYYLSNVQIIYFLSNDSMHFWRPSTSPHVYNAALSLSPHHWRWWTGHNIRHSRRISHTTLLLLLDALIQFLVK
jgi:hypothetical protein